MAQPAQFTAAEAAFVLREPLRTVKKALDAGPVRPTLERRKGGMVRVIGWSDLFYLFATQTLKNILTPKARADLYEALKNHPVDANGDAQFGRFTIELSDLIQEIQKRTRKLDELADGVEFREDGEALLKGTDIEAHRIAALLDGGMSVEDILEDYPNSLTREAIETACAYAAAYPRAGRPYPPMTVKRAMRGVGLEILDEVLDDDASE